jgi:hypothetical protein
MRVLRDHGRAQNNNKSENDAAPRIFHGYMPIDLAYHTHDNTDDKDDLTMPTVSIDTGNIQRGGQASVRISLPTLCLYRYGDKTENVSASTPLTKENLEVAFNCPDFKGQD